MSTNSEETPRLGTIINAAIARVLASVFTALPARVERYDASRREVDLQVMVFESFFDPSGAREVKEIPVVPSVPVVFPGNASGGMTHVVARGDFVLAVFASSSIDSWLATGIAGAPSDDRHHNVSDAVAIPGLFPFSGAGAAPAASTAATVVYGDEVRLGSKDAADPVVRQSDLAALKTYIDAHVHVGVTTGAASSGTPASPSPTVTGSPDLKAD